MVIRLGSAVFESHISIEIVPQKWTDTFVFPIRHDQALSPWDYAGVVKTVIRILSRSSARPSLWVPVLSPGTWFFNEVKHALRKASIPVAVTQGYTLPQVLDFSKPPGIYDAPCLRKESAEDQTTANLPENALRSLLVMSRFTAAYTSEVACNLMLRMRVTRNALQQLANLDLIEYHPNDGDINKHLLSSRENPGVKARKGIMWTGKYWPYWRIRRAGISAALRAWGVPVGESFPDRLEKYRLPNSPHRSRARQWPKWVSRALPHAEIYAGWNEVSIPGLKSCPDGLAWGTIDGVETLFWLEVESSGRRVNEHRKITARRWRKAQAYAEAAGVHLIFVLLGMPSVHEKVRPALTDVTSRCAVILANWHKRNFGKLPYPRWGEVVMD
jgi:hypothetical protein